MLQMILAFIIDLVIGDPRHIPHPVVVIGKAIERLERLLRKFISPYIGLRSSGVVLTIIIVSGTYVTMWLITSGAEKISPWLGFIISTWFLSTTLAVKGLAEAGREIFSLLSRGDLEGARKKVGWIVGRDTDNLDESEITRATVETVAENIVDGIIAPLLFGFIGGAPLAMAYKAVNTLDSMVGYKNEKYREFGWASARFDDVCNYIPARVTGLVLLVSFMLLGKPFVSAYRLIQRDAPKHPSPNSGIPEAAVAGALGIRLGGINYYGGIESFREYMGEPTTPLQKKHIDETIKIMYTASVTALLLGSLIYLILYNLRID